MVVVEGVGLQSPGDAQPQTETGGEALQGGALLPQGLGVHQGQQELPLLPVQCGFQGLLRLVHFPLFLSALRLLTEPLVQGLHVVVHVCRLLFSNTQYPNCIKIATPNRNYFQKVIICGGLLSLTLRRSF